MAIWKSWARTACLSPGAPQQRSLALHDVFGDDRLLAREVFRQVRVEFNSVVDLCPHKSAVAYVAHQVDGVGVVGQQQ